jgi:hypothetical protein
MAPAAPASPVSIAGKVRHNWRFVNFPVPFSFHFPFLKKTTPFVVSGVGSLWA